MQMEFKLQAPSPHGMSEKYPAPADAPILVSGGFYCLWLEEFPAIDLGNAGLGDAGLGIVGMLFVVQITCFYSRMPVSRWVVVVQAAWKVCSLATMVTVFLARVIPVYRIWFVRRGWPSRVGRNIITWLYSDPCDLCAITPFNP